MNSTSSDGPLLVRPLGRSDLRIPPIILGAWAYGGWFWGPPDDQTGARAVEAAVDLGLAIDTAPVYGLGHSEEVVGRGIRGRAQDAIVFTKCGLRWDDDRGEFDFDLVMPDGKKYPLYRNLRPDSVREECEASLRRLGVESIDLFQCHWPDPTTPIAETMGEMVRLHAEGKIRAVGVSNFSPEQMAEAQTALGDLPLASEQPKYNLLNRKIEDLVIPHAMDNGIGLIAYSPLEQGLLTGKMTPERVFGEGDLRARLPKFLPENRDRVNRVIEETVMPIAATHGATAAQVTAAWTFHRPGITAAIVGARTPEQVRENAGAARLRLGAGEVESMTRAFETVELVRPTRKPA